MDYRLGLDSYKKYKTYLKKCTLVFVAHQTRNPKMLLKKINPFILKKKDFGDIS